jgi:hypothetical protein
MAQRFERWAIFEPLLSQRVMPLASVFWLLQMQASRPAEY